MTRLLFILTLFLSWTLVHGQTIIENGAIKIYDGYFIFKKGESWDTLSFDDKPENYTIRTIQIDGKGLKEVILTWKYENSHVYGSPFGGGISTSYTMNVIWNLD